MVYIMFNLCFKLNYPWLTLALSKDELCLIFLNTCKPIVEYFKNYDRVTESRNHRMVGVGRDLCGSSSPTLLPKQGHLQQAEQDLVQVGLGYLQRRRLHNLPGQPVPVLRHPQREEILPHVQTEHVSSFFTRFGYLVLSC